MRPLQLPSFTSFFHFELAVNLQGQTHFSGALGVGGAELLFLALLVAAVLITRFAWAQTLSWTAAILFALLPIGQIVLASPPRAAEANLRISTEPLALTYTSRPSIWFFVADGYSRGDVLRSEYDGLAIDGFERELEERGFSIQERAVANYPHTYLSIPSTLQMDVLAEEGDDIMDRAPYYRILRGDNRLVSTLRSWGYSYAHSPADTWDGSKCSGLEDVCVNAAHLSESERAVLLMTPLRRLVESKEWARIHADRSNPVKTVQGVENANLGTPMFVFSHLMAPHPPYYRTANCQVIDAVWDTGAWGSRGQYAEAANCLNTLLIRAVDRILSRDPSAIIIIQGDHGTAHGIDLLEGNPKDWSPEDIKRRMGVFSAMRLPIGCPTPDDLRLVNTFRLVLDCISREGLDPLLAGSWIASLKGNDLMAVEPPT